MDSGAWEVIRNEEKGYHPSERSHFGHCGGGALAVVAEDSRHSEVFRSKGQGWKLTGHLGSVLSGEEDVPGSEISVNNPLGVLESQSCFRLPSGASLRRCL